MAEHARAEIPPDMTETTAAVAKRSGESIGHTTAPTSNPSPAASADESDGAATDELDPSYWHGTPCNVIDDQHKAACVAEHERIGIPADGVESVGGVPDAQPPESAPSCGYAGDGYRPVVDMQDVDPNQFECDLGACQTYAARVSPAQNAVAGAAVGAIVGALFGLAVSNHGWAARAGAQGGAVGGALNGGGSAVAARVNIVRNCMAGRGYRVLQ